MATKRDLVEAHAFSRRRLVTAFVSGAPGGREVEPARPGRVLVGGAALAVLLVAGAAIGGVFSRKTPDDWAQPGLFIAQETGAPYVITDDDPVVVRPVINITSAMLILGSGAEPTIVSQEAIAAETLGEDVGILGAPSTPPEADALIDDGWTACTATGAGVRVAVQPEPGVTVLDGAGAVVTVGRDHYLLASTLLDGSTPATFSYRLPREEAARDNMLDDLGLQASTYHSEVSEDFLALFPSGGELALTSMGLSGIGEPATYADAASGLPAGSRVGDLVLQTDGTPLVLTAEGPAELDPFAYAVYRNLPGDQQPRQRTMTERLGMGQVRAPFAEAQWPTTVLTPVPGEQVCSQLSTEPGSAPYVRLAGDPGDDATSAGVAEREVSVQVSSGHGAYVLSGDWTATDSGSPYLIDAKGKRYALVGPDTPDRLGYADHEPPVVPDSWVQLFRRGVPLSPDAALCPPETQAGTSCE